MLRLENVWSGAGGLTHPYIVWGNHKDFIRYGGKIISGNTLSTAMNIMADAIDAASDRGVNVVAIMLTGVHYIDKCLEIVERRLSGILGVYAHSGRFVDPNWIFENTVSPKDHVKGCPRWMTKEATAIGGCCGSRPGHIAALHGVV
jgi:S-methylmethionine-dependent homocysteine/selenocysteine methylase